MITTAHLCHRDEAAEPRHPAGSAQSCLLPVAYYSGDDVKPAVRRPVHEMCFIDRWGEPLLGD